MLNVAEKNWKIFGKGSVSLKETLHISWVNICIHYSKKQHFHVKYSQMEFHEMAVIKKSITFRRILLTVVITFQNVVFVQQ